MNAAVLISLGKPPKFQHFSDPVPGEGEVIVQVRAASLKPVDKQIADGSHYASPRELPVVCGMDGLGALEDGKRVYFGGPRRPFGAMAELSVVRRVQCFDVPQDLDDATAAALPNPAVSAWLSLAHRAKLARGENVLILGATGVTGKLAIQIAKILGAARVVAAGRNEGTLRKLPDLGADATISLELPEEQLRQIVAREVQSPGIHVILDYVWGKPAETVLAALTQSEFAQITHETRWVQVGESAGPAIQLPAAVLRSRALTITGTAGIPAPEILVTALREVLQRGASGQLRIEVDRIPLRDVEKVWNQDRRGRRVVFIP